MRHLTVHWHNAEASVSRKPRLVLMLQTLPCHHQQTTFTGWAFNPQQNQLTDTAIAVCLVRPRRSQMPASVLVNRREMFTLLLLLWGHGLPFKDPSKAQRVHALRATHMQTATLADSNSSSAVKKEACVSPVPTRAAGTLWNYHTEAKQPDLPGRQRGRLNTGPAQGSECVPVACVNTAAACKETFLQAVANKGTQMPAGWT
ncbi:hypothetical protein ACRRTK_018296 [Alexandromys fortis]